MAGPRPANSLVDFALARGQGLRVCVVCRLPQVTEINKTRAVRISMRMTCETIRQWLIQDCGVKPKAITAGALRRHFMGKHHLQD